MYRWYKQSWGRVLTPEDNPHPGCPPGVVTPENVNNIITANQRITYQQITMGTSLTHSLTKAEEGNWVQKNTQTI